jgi:hypothetical protein
MTKVISLIDYKILKLAEQSSKKILEDFVKPSDFHSSLNLFRVRRMLENW